MRSTAGGLSIADMAGEVGLSDEAVRQWLADEKHPLYGKAIVLGKRTVRMPREVWEAWKASRPAYKPAPPKKRGDAAPAPAA